MSPTTSMSNCASKETPTKNLVAAVAGAICLTSFCLPPAPATAQEATGPQGEVEAASSLLLELNALQSSERGCRFTFLAANALGGDLASAAFEVVLFDKAGMINRLIIIDFKDLPEGKTKVRQFDFPGVDCSDVGRVLINDATECAGEGVEANACIRRLKAETLTDVAFGS